MSTFMAIVSRGLWCPGPTVVPEQVQGIVGVVVVSLIEGVIVSTTTISGVVQDC